MTGARIAAVQLLQRELERIAFHDRRGLLAVHRSRLYPVDGKGLVGVNGVDLPDKQL